MEPFRQIRANFESFELNLIRVPYSTVLLNWLSKQFFMFRTGADASPSPCPFAGVHAFSYSTRSGNGAERCEEPASHLEQCTQPERMVFRFSACPDVRGSESGGEW